MEAQLHDGTILEFPDGTDPAVIQATVKKTLASRGAAAPAAPTSKSEQVARITRDGLGLSPDLPPEPPAPREPEIAEKIAANPATRFALKAAAPFFALEELVSAGLNKIGIPSHPGGAESYARTQEMIEKGKETQPGVVRGVGGVADVAGTILSPAALKIAKAIPVASGAKGFARIPQAGKNVVAGAAGGTGFGLLQPVGETDDLFGAKLNQAESGALFGGAAPVVIEPIKAVGAGFGNAIGPHIGKIDAAKYLPESVRDYVRKYLPSAFQGETTGAERAAARIATDPKIGNAKQIPSLLAQAKPGETAAQAAAPAGSAEFSALEKLAGSAQGTTKASVEAAQRANLKSQLDAVAGGKSQAEAVLARRATKTDLGAKLGPKFEAELAAANAKGIDTSKITKGLSDLANDPIGAGNKTAQRVLRDVSKQIDDWTEKNGGVIDPKALQALRINAVSDAVNRALKTSDPSTVQKQTAALTLQLKPLIDDAIVKAGGKGWIPVMKEWQRGEEAISRRKLGAVASDLFETNPSKLISLGKNNEPELVEKTLGRGKVKLGPNHPITKVADVLSRNQEVNRLAEAGRPTALKILRADETLPTAPGLVDWRVSSLNKAIRAISGTGGEKTNEALGSLMLTDPKRLAKLMGATTPTEEQMLIEAILARGLLSGGASLAGELSAKTQKGGK